MPPALGCRAGRLSGFSTRGAGRCRARERTGGWGAAPPEGVLRLGRGSGLALGLVLLWMSILVILPLAAVLFTSTSNGFGAFVDTDHQPGGGRLDSIDGDDGRGRHRGQHGARDVSRLGAGP